MSDIDPESVDFQMALALTALTYAFVRTLQDVPSQQDPLVLFQRNLVAGIRMLKHTPHAHRATDIVRYVRDALRDPDIIRQPE